MDYYSIHEWEEHFDVLFERVENGEPIGIIDKEGKSFVMAPIDEETRRLYTDHNEAS
jgi:antitoxin (DNA-binding transcriptional repressor) of toxin-antitoxin stability system